MPTPHPSRSRAPLLLLALLALLASSVFLCPFVHTHLQSAALLNMVQSGRPDWLMSHTILGPVREEDLQIPSPAGPIRARVYTPLNHPDAPGVVIVHGVHHLGINEPRMVAFARAFAACGVRVLTPEMADLRDFDITPASVTRIGVAAQWFAARTGSPVGVMGISFSGGLALMAAARPEFAPSIRYVFTVGSHSSMRRVAAFYLTGSAPRPDGSTQSLTPHEYGPLLLEYLHPEDFIASAADRAAILPVLQAHLYEQPDIERSRMAALTPAQRALILQLLNTRSPHVLSALAASAARHAAEMDAISPAGHVASLHTPVYLLHGSADNVIPSAELLWLQQDLPASTIRAALLTPLLTHVNMEDDRSSLAARLRTRWQLVHLFAAVLQSSERHM